MYLAMSFLLLMLTVSSASGFGQSANALPLVEIVVSPTSPPPPPPPPTPLYRPHPSKKHQQLLGAPPNVEGKPTPPEQWFEQSLDHFHPTDDRQWKQRYWVSTEFYRPGGPAFLMIGGEGPANPIWMVAGSWIEYAKAFGAVIFQLEHRFYGDSHPTSDLSVKNLVYLSSEQALADLASFVTAMNEQNNLTDTKWISFGGSYPGSLSAWFRLKYPHLVHGAVSTSGPLHAKADFFEYLQVVSDALDVTNPRCRPAVQEAMKMADMLMLHRIGWQTISKMFKLCSPFDGTNDDNVATLFESLIGNFEDIVQYNKDNKAFEGGKHDNVTIDTLCDIMVPQQKERVDPVPGDRMTLEDFSSFLHNSFLNRFDQTPANKDSLELFADVNDLYLKLHDQECFDVSYESMINELRNITFGESVGGRQWTYQTCTEFGWYQSSDQPGHPYTGHFPVAYSEKMCTDIFGPKYNSKLLERGIRMSNINYGGKNIQVTNVIFVHGSIDPWHALGVTQDLSDEATAIFITGTAHCANMYPESDSDPPQLKIARRKIMQKIKQWLQ